MCALPSTVATKEAAGGMFRSLRVCNFRIWAGGAIVSNAGTWMQRVAQDWLVLTQPTHDNASAVGVVMALQFGPQLVLLPWTGCAADHFDRRKLLFATQGMPGLLALVGTFGLNFPIFVSSMAVKVFHAGASRYGLFTSAMAISSVTGVLLFARRAKPYFALLAGAAGAICTQAAAVGLRHLPRHGGWRIRVDARRLRVTVVTDPVSEA